MRAYLRAELIQKYILDLCIQKKNLIALITIIIDMRDKNPINKLFIAMSMIVHIRYIKMAGIRCFICI